MKYRFVAYLYVDAHREAVSMKSVPYRDSLQCEQDLEKALATGAFTGGRLEQYIKGIGWIMVLDGGND